MTGFATRSQRGAEFSWVWEMRSVNGKGLDLRMRLPDWIEGLEQALRTEVGRTLVRGNVSISLKVSRETTPTNMQIDSGQLTQVLGALAEISREAERQGLELKPPTTAEILAMKGMTDGVAPVEDTLVLRGQLLSDFRPLLIEFAQARATEGAALHAILLGKLDDMEQLIAQANQVAEARKEDMAEMLRANLARVMENAEGLDEARVAQELALLALKADVTEELDRMGAHLEASRDLLGAPEAVGRKLDFLCQEFNREANTLCSKSQSVDLTRVGLDMKALIDQIREQVQNVE